MLFASFDVLFEVCFMVRVTFSPGRLSLEGQVFFFLPALFSSLLAIEDFPPAISLDCGTCLFFPSSAVGLGLPRRFFMKLSLLLFEYSLFSPELLFFFYFDVLSFPV